MHYEVIEGEWEEILSRAQRLAGRRVTVIVEPEAEPALSPEDRVRALDALAAELRHLPGLPEAAFDRE